MRTTRAQPLVATSVSVDTTMLRHLAYGVACAVGNAGHAAVGRYASYDVVRRTAFPVRHEIGRPGGSVAIPSILRQAVRAIGIEVCSQVLRQVLAWMVTHALISVFLKATTSAACSTWDRIGGWILA
ncbi:MAG: hypothetical protein QOG75_3863 [Mycobacterium sp.]|nr:hypothetical protein [Mycobacterium sp.]